MVIGLRVPPRVRCSRLLRTNKGQPQVWRSDHENQGKPDANDDSLAARHVSRIYALVNPRPNRESVRALALLSLLTRPTFLDGFAYLAGAMDQEELLLFALG